MGAAQAGLAVYRRQRICQFDRVEGIRACLFARQCLRLGRFHPGVPPRRHPDIAHKLGRRRGPSEPVKSLVSEQHLLERGGLGGLIQTSVGVGAGVGRPAGNRSGWAAYVVVSTAARSATRCLAKPKCTRGG